MPTTSTEWLADFTANSSTEGVQEDVRSFQLGNGNIWVAWTDRGPGAPAEVAGADVVGQLYDPLGNAIGGPVRLNEAFIWGEEANASFASAIGSDQFFMIYENRHTSAGGSFNEFVMERRAGDGTFLGGGLVITDSTGAGGYNVRNPEIAIASGSNGLIIWESTNNAGDTDIHARVFNGLSFLQVFSVWDQDDDSYDAEVTVLANGNYAIVWTDEFNGSPNDLDVRGAIYDQAGTLVTAYTAGYTTAAESDSSIAALTGGGFVVGFTHANAANNGDVGIRIFDAAGAAQGAMITVAGGADVQGESVVARTNDGGFVVAWTNTTTGVTAMQGFTATGTPVGDVTVIATDVIAPDTLSLVALADGRILASYDLAGTGDAHSRILDPRPSLTGAPSYMPTGWYIGTLHNDAIEAPAGTGQIHLMDGDDTVLLHGLSAGGTADGGAGTDTLSLTALTAEVVVDLAAGTASSNGESMAVTNFESYVSGGPVRHDVSGTAGANYLETGSGNDRLDGRGGADVMAGGGGNDDYFVDDAGDEVLEKGSEGTDRVWTSVSYQLAEGAHVEVLGAAEGAGTGAFSLTGNSLANTIYGNAGANVLDGKDGNDLLIGGAGADTMRGGNGDDMIFVDNAADMVVEMVGGGSDRILASVNYTMGAGVHVEMLTTDNNNGTAAINLGGNELAQTIYGNAGDNVLYGLAGADTLVGLAGHDTLVGGLGNDTMIGGLGDDLYYVDSTSDAVIELAGQGSDRILTSVSFTLGAGIDVERLTTANNAGTEAIDLTGSGADNLIYGNAGSNVLDGRGGADTLVGFGGDDRYYVDHAGDVVSEAAGGGADRIFASVSYTMGAGVHVETLTTTNNNGTDAFDLTGNELANTIYGNAGANVLDGKGGADILVGLAGADTFAFTTALGGGNVDTVSGFNVADDTIRLDNAVFTGLAEGALAAGAFNTGSAATQADDRIIYNNATGALLFDADGLGGAAAVQFATLTAGLALTSADFIVV